MTEQQLHEIAQQIAQLIVKRDEMLDRLVFLINANQIESHVFQDFVEMIQVTDIAIIKLTMRVAKAGVPFPHFSSIISPIMQDLKLDTIEAINKIAC